MHYIKDRITIAPASNNNLSIIEVSYIYKGHIQPNRVIKEKEKVMI